MAIFSKGADPDALRQSASRLRAHADTCDDASDVAGATVRSLRGQWAGPDLEHLIRRWPTAQHDLTAASATLRDLATHLDRNAAAQSTASSFGGPGAGGHGSPAPSSPRRVGHLRPHEPRHWWESALDTAGQVGTWAYNHTVVPGVNELADIGQAMAEHPQDVVGLALGAGAIVLGSGGEVGGGVLDITGLGAVAGVPLNVAAAGLIALGATTMAAAGADVALNAAQNHDTVLNEASSPRTGSRGTAGEPLPENARPDTAGQGWRGRVSDNGNGEVWQDPADVNPPAGTPRNANSIRISDPDAQNPQGYVRFYNEHGQPLRLDGKPGGRTDPLTHIPVRPDGTYDVPQGWNP